MKHPLILPLLALMTLAALANDTIPAYRSYAYEGLPGCAQLEYNTLVFPAGEDYRMRRLVAKLDSVLLYGIGKVNILHLGGSHVQADMYTHVIRRQLDSLNHNGLRPSRGFIFPYSVAKTNNPYNYKVKYQGNWTPARNSLKKFLPTQGLSGINVQTTDTAAWFRITLNADTVPRYSAQSLKIFGYCKRHNIEPIVILPDSSLIMAYQIDSDTTALSSVYCFDLPNNTQEFQVAMKFSSEAIAQTDTFTLTGLLTENNDQGIVYHSVGVNGASVPSYLGCNDFGRDVSVIKPDLVIFAIGINDATMRDFSDSLLVTNYSLLIDEIRKAAPDCALMFITNNDSYKKQGRRNRVPNPNGKVAQNAFYQLARKWQAGVWDLFKIMGGFGSMQKWQDKGLSQKDKVHFTRAGYNIVGHLFADAFMEYYLDAEWVD